MTIVLNYDHRAHTRLDTPKAYTLYCVKIASTQRKYTKKVFNGSFEKSLLSTKHTEYDLPPNIQF